VVLRFKYVIEHFAEERLSLLQLVLLILDFDARRRVIIDDLAPRIEKVNYSVLYAAQPLFSFGFVCEGLLTYPLKEISEQPAFKFGAYVSNPLYSTRR
jgi:hypothetical protein